MRRLTNRRFRWTTFLKRLGQTTSGVCPFSPVHYGPYIRIPLEVPSPDVQKPLPPTLNEVMSEVCQVELEVLPVHVGNDASVTQDTEETQPLHKFVLRACCRD